MTGPTPCSLVPEGHTRGATPYRIIYSIIFKNENEFKKDQGPNPSPLPTLQLDVFEDWHSALALESESRPLSGVAGSSLGAGCPENHAHQCPNRTFAYVTRNSPSSTEVYETKCLEC